MYPGFHISHCLLSGGQVKLTVMQVDFGKFYLYTVHAVICFESKNFGNQASKNLCMYGTLVQGMELRVPYCPVYKCKRYLYQS